MTTHQNHISKTASLLGVCLAIASAYFAREVFMPIAAAILFAFLLVPLAERLEQIHLGRTASALVAVFIGIGIVSVLAYCLLIQFDKFGNELPKYEQNIHARLRHLGIAEGGPFNRATKSLEEFKNDLTPANAAPATNSGASTNSVLAANPIQDKTTNQPPQKAVPVEIRNPNSSILQMVRNLVGPLLNVLTTSFLVTVFCIFMLLGRDDLRARVIRVMGPRNAKLTSKVLTDTGERLSRYLLMQLIVNVVYGIVIGLGLLAIGIPNPLLWGMVAALFRYIPYAGPWIAASLPFAVAFAMDSDWVKPLLVLALFGVVEISTANFLEPLLYGNSTGITPLAVLLAAVFWTWLWGPVGLLLSMPLTVCLVSIAKYVPQLELLNQLFAKTEK